MTTDKKPWFLVMGPTDANRPGSDWVRVGASRRRVVALPIAPAGWLVLFGFVALMPVMIVGIWVGLFVTLGVVTLIEAIVMTVLVAAALVTGLIMTIRARMTRLPPADHPPL